MEDQIASRKADCMDDYPHCCYADEKFLGTHELYKQRVINEFRSVYAYASDINNNTERKTCIWSGGKFSWQDQSSGIMWAVVHGMNSICVVTTKKLDKKRVDGRLFKIHARNTILYKFMETLIYEIEDGSFPKSDQSIEKPFGIVSMIQDTNKVRKESGHEASSADYDENATINFLTEKMKTNLALTLDDTIQVSGAKYDDDENAAIDFLTEKMKTDSALTLDDTIQTAISALQHMYGKKFRAHQIMGCVLKENKKYVVGLFPIQIKKHLAVINKFLPHLPIPSPMEFMKKTKRSRTVAEELEEVEAVFKLLFPLKKKRTNRILSDSGGGGPMTISEDLSKLSIV